MPGIGKGVPPAASLSCIIKNLFQNEIMSYCDGTSIEVIFSRAKLSLPQKQSLVYPNGLVPIGLYIIYQTIKNGARHDCNCDNNSVLLSSQLISFTQKCDGFIYGVYYDLVNQAKICDREMTRCSNPIEILPSVQINSGNYLEVYHDVVGTTVILGLSTDVNNVSASLQYGHKSKYFYDQLASSGIKDSDIPKTCLTGLSENLTNINFHK